MHQVGHAVGAQMAGGDELGNGVGCQDDHVKGLASLHTFGGIHATDRLNRDGLAGMRGVGRGHFCQQLARGHGGDAFQWRRMGGSRAVHGGNFVRSPANW